MANRIKEDEKNEKIIRGLLKLQANRRCINCSSLGPQYVCTNFWTFVCTTCSGIHREFTHRVKSVSMAKFTSQEVSALQGGGNERAREIYFKEWDSQRHSAPDSSNVDRLRDFIRHVYVDRRYTGERSIDKPPRVKMGDEDPHENRRVDTYRGSSRSPPYEDTHDRRYSERSGLGGRNDDRNYRYNYDERRSPGNDQETRYGNYRRSPVRFEVVDYKHRDDRFGNGRRPDGESKLEERSPNRQKDLDVSSPPMVRPVREILGEDVPPLRISEPPKANGGKATDGSTRTQRTASSSSLGSIDGSSVEIKGANLGSLIDFNADPELPDATVVPPEQPTTISTAQSVTQTATTPSVDGGNWASFDFPSQAQAQAPASVPAPAPAPSNANTLESMLSQLSVLAPAPAGNMSALSIGGGTPTNAPVSNMSILPIGGGAPAAAVGNISTIPIGVGIAATPVGNMSTLPNSGGGSAAPPGGMTSMLPISGGDFFVKANDGRQFPSIQQQQPSLFTTTVNQSATPQSTVSVGGAPNNQPWNSSLVQNAQGQMTATGQPSQADSKPAQETIGGVASQPALSEVKNSGRKELPVDLFAATFSTVPGWHTGTPHGMGFGMQYPTAAQMPTYLYPSKPSNPFDLNNEPTMVHAPSYPSMTSLQGALPNMAAPPGLLRTYSLGTPSHGTPSPRWMTPQSPSYASAVPPSAYMGQQVPPSNVPALGHQGGGGFGGEAALFGSVGTDQQLAGRYSQPATPNSFSSLGGNPFG